jgi:hypothetical protein
MVVLKPGDMLEFSNGAVYPVLGILGKGFTTLVIDIGHEKVLRIPKHKRMPYIKPPANQFFHSSSIDVVGDTYDMDYTQFTTATLEGYQTLRQAGVPTVALFVDESLAGEYVVAQKINIAFFLDAILGKYRKVDPATYKAAEEALIRFAHRSAHFQAIGDFKANQLAFDGTDWVLVDWTTRSVAAQFQNDPNIFQKFIEAFDAPLRRKLQRTIRQARESAGLSWKNRGTFDWCLRWLM